MAKNMEGRRLKAYDQDGFPVWAIIGDRKGWNRSDYRRVWVKDDGIHFIKLNGCLVKLDAVKHRTFTFGPDGETRNCVL